MAPNGTFVVVWATDDLDGSGTAVYGQRFGASGNRLGGEFRVNTTTINDQTNPSVAIDGSGNFVVAWQGVTQFPQGNWDIYAQRFDYTGAPVGGEVLVNS